MEPDYMEPDYKKPDYKKQGSKSTYKKFAAINKKIIGNNRLWVGQDHLLMVESTGISEKYKRFYFKDIQVINIVKTNTALLKIIALSVLTAVTGILGKVIWNSSVNKTVIIIPGIISLIFLFYLILLIVKGSSCKCWIYSSVRKEKITPVNNMKTAKKFLKTIVPKIEKIQGILPLEALSSKKQNVTAKPSAVLRDVIEKPPKIISLFWHKALFLLSMILGIFLLISLLFHSPAITIANGFIFFTIMVICIIAVVRQSGSALIRSIKVISIATLVLLTTGVLIEYIEYTFFFIKRAEEWEKIAHNQWEIIKLLSRIDPFDYPVILWKEIISIAFYFLLGLTGLLCIWKLEK